MMSTEECLSDPRLMHMCTDKDCGSRHRACPGFSPDRVTTMRGGCRHRLPPPIKKLSATDTHQLGKYQFFPVKFHRLYQSHFLEDSFVRSRQSTQHKFKDIFIDVLPYFAFFGHFLYHWSFVGLF